MSAERGPGVDFTKVVLIGLTSATQIIKVAQHKKGSFRFANTQSHWIIFMTCSTKNRNRQKENRFYNEKLHFPLSNCSC